MKSSYKLDGYGNLTIDKDPDAILDYSPDWSEWLAEVSDTIAAYDVTVVGVTLNSKSKVGSVITAWISGGVVGQYASATFHITTLNGRTDERTVLFNIKQR